MCACVYIYICMSECFCVDVCFCSACVCVCLHVLLTKGTQSVVACVSAGLDREEAAAVPGAPDAAGDAAGGTDVCGGAATAPRPGATAQHCGEKTPLKVWWFPLVLI